MFRWPNTDAYNKLTRGHYRIVTLSPIPLGHRFQSVGDRKRPVENAHPFLAQGTAGDHQYSPARQRGFHGPPAVFQFHPGF